jgi:hypothetical protein
MDHLLKKSSILIRWICFGWERGDNLGVRFTCKKIRYGYSGKIVHGREGNRIREVIFSREIHNLKS